MTTPTFPSDDRLDGPIHSWFGLSYSNYLVLYRSMMQSMPVEWQTRAVALFDELDQAYTHLDKPTSYIVQPAREVEYGDLNAAERKLVDARDLVDHEAWERTLVPTGADPVPHYNRGRTYLPPQGADHQ